MISSRHRILALIFSAAVTGGATAACSDEIDGTGGSGGGVSTGGSTATGGATGTGGAASGGGTATGGVTNSGGVANSGGSSSGGAATGGADGGSNTGGSATGTGGAAAGGADGSGGAEGTGGGGSTNPDGPCDVLNAAGNECVAAYSTVRRLLSTYDGPLYQLRVGSSEYNIGGQRVTNPMQAIAPKNGTRVEYTTEPEMGTLVDVPQTAAGFGDPSTVTTNCPIGTTCTVAKIYDQSGKGNDITVGKGGLPDGGDYAALDDFETVMNSRAALKVGGQDVYSLYMEQRQGYRQTERGNEIPVGTEAEGMYMLADGTHAGGACCWDFGNATPAPAVTWKEMNTLFFGEAYWGNGNDQPPWFGADFEAGVWMGGSEPGDPGWGDLDANQAKPPNPDMPSMNGVKFALGFLKTNDNAPDYTYALAAANLMADDALKRAYEGPYPKSHPPDHQGSIVLGVGGDNSNNSFGTLYEAALYKGYPSNETEQAVMDNIKAIGYGQ